MADSDETAEPPPFYEGIAASYLGKYILIGLTYLDHEGNALRHDQLHGIITSATRQGITISLRGVHDGELWSMPPDLRAIEQADPGSYRLRATGEVIENPDLLSNWTITPPPRQSNA